MSASEIALLGEERGTEADGDEEGDPETTAAVPAGFVAIRPCKNSAISRKPLAAAVDSAVAPVWVVSDGSAPACNNIFTISLLPLLAARMSAVLPSGDRLSISAPLSSNILMTSLCSDRALKRSARLRSVFERSAKISAHLALPWSAGETTKSSALYCNFMPGNSFTCSSSDVRQPKKNSVRNAPNTTPPALRMCGAMLFSRAPSASVLVQPRGPRTAPLFRELGA